MILPPRQGQINEKHSTIRDNKLVTFCVVVTQEILVAAGVAVVLARVFGRIPLVKHVPLALPEAEPIGIEHRLEPVLKL